MEYLPILLAFAGVHFLAASSPGPNLILVTSHAVTYSYKAALMLSFGIVIGTFVWSSAAALGLGILITKFPNIYFILQHVGAVYLIWLGFKMLRNRWKNSYEEIGTTVSINKTGRKLLATGFLVNMTNPKSIVYWTSLYSVILPAESPAWVFSATIVLAMSISMAWWTAVSLFFSQDNVQSIFLSFRKYLDMVMGGALIFLGLKIVSSK